MDNININFLTEEKLGILLKDIYGKEFIHNKQFPNNKFRPDYRNDELKLIVEFDGVRHFTESKRIISDIERDLICYKLGYTVIRIPYFISISSESIKYFFDKTINYLQSFPHGFINKNIILPANFCYLGYIKFIRILYTLPKTIYNDIQLSLINKIENEKLKYYECFTELYSFYSNTIEQEELIKKLDKYNITNFGFIIEKTRDINTPPIYINVFDLFLYKRRLNEIAFKELLINITKYSLV